MVHYGGRPGRSKLVLSKGERSKPAYFGPLSDEFRHTLFCASLPRCTGRH